MRERVLFWLIAIFWITMNVLLWRSETLGRVRLTTSVPPRLIWNRVLESPDYSVLEVLHRGKRLGLCRWLAMVSHSAEEETTNAPVIAREEVEGRIRRASGYSIEFSGNVVLEKLGNFRFQTHLMLTNNYEWRHFNLRLSLKNATISLNADTENQELYYRYEDSEGFQEKTFPLQQLKDPSKTLADMTGPVPLALLTTLGYSPPLSSELPHGLEGLVNITAHNDTLKLGRTPVRVYRLEARLLDRYRAAAYISRAGEILKVELPDGITLINNEVSPP